MATVILINPMGSDVTNFVNGTFGIPQLMMGTVMSPGDTLYTLPYNNTSGAANVNAAVPMLDTKIHSEVNAGHTVKLFAYSEGGQVIDKWLHDYGQSTPVPVNKLSCLSIANANSKFGGFAYNQAAFNAVGYTAGQPPVVPYPYTIFTRQYDGVADFPYDPMIRAAMGDIQTATANPNVWTKALSDVLGLITHSKMPSLNRLVAAENAINGMVLIHNIYLYIKVSDPQNATYIDPSNGVKYVWSPTYPVPLLGVATWSPSADKQLRTEIEDCYPRPVNLHLPNYAASATNIFAPMGWSLH
jgi:PE-PPE domain